MATSNSSQRYSKDQELVPETGLCAVTGNLPEGDIYEITEAADQQFARELTTKVGVTEALAPKQLHRRGPYRNGRARIVKVPFTDVSSPNEFIRRIYRFRPRSQNPLACAITCRRDLMSAESAIHYEKAKSWYEMNQRVARRHKKPRAPFLRPVDIKILTAVPASPSRVSYGFSKLLSTVAVGHAEELNLTLADHFFLMRSSLRRKVTSCSSYNARPPFCYSNGLEPLADDASRLVTRVIITGRTCGICATYETAQWAREDCT
ncbi:hypothetical protein Tcan_10184 [Toxocara canis]|uniref:Uncharacterized protein n=1 Tax=Toxocara canis TaxID=6265 RepID=A0A0B2UX43_TOXCA|nr:hypothetical protein Tcan_10184 [Toxocara canis]